jgi:hypothetical protein
MGARGALSDDHGYGTLTMMERRTLGDILINTGRVSFDEVTRALEHQREHGGYFGEALVALKIVTPEELEWSLASQFDLPNVFPEVETIDPEAAAMVTPEWALANLALPIMRTKDVLTVVVDSPLKSKALEELQARTDRTIELALASPSRIRDLVRGIFTRQSPEGESDSLAPVTLERGFSLALSAAAARFGISARGPRTWFWYDDQATIRRRPLDAGWMDALDQLVSPPPSTRVGNEREVTYEAQVNREGVVGAVELRYFATDGGREFLFRPVRESPALQERFPPPTAGLLSEIRLLARSGSARFLVHGDPDELAKEVLPYLPALLLDPTWRSLHMSADAANEEDGVFDLSVGMDGQNWVREADSMRAFCFDAVTVDPPPDNPAVSLPALDVAPVAFVLWKRGGDRAPAIAAGMRWELSVARAEGRQLLWELTPLQV